jgi:hypothetical protein
MAVLDERKPAGILDEAGPEPSPLPSDKSSLTEENLRGLVSVLHAEVGQAQAATARRILEEVLSNRSR